MTLNLYIAAHLTLPTRWGQLLVTQLSPQQSGILWSSYASSINYVNSESKKERAHIGGSGTTQDPAIFPFLDFVSDLS